MAVGLLWNRSFHAMTYRPKASYGHTDIELSAFAKKYIRRIRIYGEKLIFSLAKHRIRRENTIECVDFEGVFLLQTTQRCFD